jgi:hypothetical protein
MTWVSTVFENEKQYVSAARSAGRGGSPDRPCIYCGKVLEPSKYLCIGFGVYVCKEHRKAVAA